MNNDRQYAFQLKEWSVCINIRINISRYALVMASTLIRYCNTVLLAWAVMALVLNPVLHAFSHDHFDHPEDVTESVSGIQWTGQGLCPYCDAVSQFVEPPTTETTNDPVVFQWSIESFVILYPDLRLLLSTRLRAPPLVA